MNRGNNLLREVLKVLNNSKEMLDNGQYSYQTVCDQQRKSIAGEKTEEEVKTIRLHKKQKNTYTRLQNSLPFLSAKHVYKLFGFLGINERAIEDQDHQESFFSSHFHDRIVEKVEYYDNALVVHLSPPEAVINQFSIPEIIEFYRKKGDIKFLELSNMIEELYQLFGLFGSEETPSEKPESLKKSLDTLGNSMFIVSTGMRKVAISKSLLTYLQYDVDEFAIEAVKFRAIFAELFSANSYFMGLMHLLNLFKYTIELNKGEITFSEFRELSNLHYTDFIYSKNHVKSYCDISLFLLNPSLLCHKINFIYYQAPLEGWKPNGCSQRARAIQGQKQRIRQNQYRVIKRVKDIPDSLLIENQKLIAGYKVVREEDADDSV